MDEMGLRSIRRSSAADAASWTGHFADFFITPSSPYVSTTNLGIPVLLGCQPDILRAQMNLT